MYERVLYAHSLWHPPVSSSPALVLLTLTYNRCASTRVTCACLYTLSEMRSPPLVPLFANIHTICWKLAAASSASRLSGGDVFVFLSWVTRGGRNGHFTPTVLQLLFVQNRLNVGVTQGLDSFTSCERLPHFKLKQGVLHHTECLFYLLLWWSGRHLCGIMFTVSGCAVMLFFSPLREKKIIIWLHFCSYKWRIKVLILCLT